MRKNITEKLNSLLKIIRISSFLFIFLCACTLSFAQQDKTFFRGKINADDVYIRSGPNKNFETLCKVKKGTSLIVTKKKYDWYNIVLPVQADCFIYSDLVTISQYESYSNADNVNLRARSNTTSSIIGQVNKYDKIHILQKEEKGWYKIEPPQSASGWVHSNFITFSENIQDIPLENPKASITNSDNTDMQEENAPSSSADYCPQDAANAKPISNTENNIISPSQNEKFPANNMKTKAAYTETAIIANSSEIEKIISTVKVKQISEKEDSNITSKSDNSTFIMSPPIAEGFINDAGKLLFNPGSHKLTTEKGDFISYLKSDTIDLSAYVYYKAKIWGTEELNRKYRIIKVKKLEIIPVGQ